MDSPGSQSIVSAAPCLFVEEERNDRWFREEIQAHEADLRAYLRSRFSGLPDIEDVIHDCYVRLLKLRAGGPVPVTRAFIFVVARNVALDLIRRNQIVALTPLDQIPASSVVEEAADAADQFAHAEELQLLDAAIRDLPPRCREILILQRLHGHSYREIARQLQITESTVHAQLIIAIKRCRTYLCAHGVTSA